MTLAPPQPMEGAPALGDYFPIASSDRCPCPWGYFPDLYDCDHYVYCEGTETPVENDCSDTVDNGLYNPDLIQV